MPPIVDAARPPELGRVTKNFVANLAGSGWNAVVGLVCTPLYIRFMGMEAYGLVGFYVMLLGVIQILDLGLGPTMNREMARYSAMPEKADEARDLVRTLEVGYWAMGALIGSCIWLGAPLIATHWIKAGGFSHAELRDGVALMGLLAAFQWPLSLYRGGLMGLQRQVLLNGINIAMAALSGGGALLMLWLVAPTVRVFFTWQAGVAALQAALTTVALWRCLPRSDRPARIVPGLLRNVWRFAAGMSGITLTALVLTQLDKVILSRMLPLERFGHYVLAAVAGNSLSALVIAPTFNTIFPRFSSLVASGNRSDLLQLYHGATQVMAVLVLPATAVLLLFPAEIMLLWTRDPAVARVTAPIVAVFAAGTALNGLMNLPYALQLAHGWTRIGLAINACFIVCLVPAIILMTANYGPLGAAAVWPALNVIYMAVGVPLTHRRLLKGESIRWLAVDAGLPLAGAVVVALAARALLPPFTRPATAIMQLTLTLSSAMLVATLLAQAPRNFVLALFRRRRTAAGDPA